MHDALVRCTRPARFSDMYAFTSGYSRYRGTNPKVRLLNEYFRLLGLGSQHASARTIEDMPFTVSNEWWRISDVNCTYTMCPTYPSALVVPNSIRLVGLLDGFYFWCIPDIEPMVMLVHIQLYLLLLQ